ncbi:SDR family NAD(P)-dependent oxidoreductase [Sphingosinithalassobacter portus]|uniref:SDR family NAD(P)-dependent oxidoreductase n=1 Tax=Stakelama portus TaxID=2676234 RepID=UPI000D6E1BD8|nr:SDR family oxidoreductase [Sphingosinithalassobacter portus]
MRDPLDFSGKRVFVVGGSSGIGNGIARRFLDQGAEVHVCGTRAAASDYRPEDGDLSGLCYAQLDVTDRGALATFRPAFDQLDVLVLSQGTVVYNRGEFEPEGWDRVMAVNLDSVMACATRFKSMLAEQRGSLIILSSVVAIATARGNPAYAASKAGAKHLTATLGEAWAAEGIRVNGIAPGLVHTKMTSVTMDNPRRAAAAVQGIPLGRAAEPAEMGGVALFLASPLASYIIGETIVVDGGYTLAR